MPSASANPNSKKKNMTERSRITKRKSENLRKIKVNYYQLMDVLAMHLEGLKMISKDEHVEITPLVKSNNMITVYVYPNKDI